jgi:ketosteroid isomerase-like protein
VVDSDALTCDVHAKPRQRDRATEMKTPWAVLLVKFSDHDTEPYDRTRYEQIFTASGAGQWSMPDYFADMSHGMLDLSGSKVFGWYKLSQKQSEYTGSGANPQGRKDLIGWARDKAAEAAVNLTDFYSVIVVLNLGADLCGGADGVVCGDDGSNLALSGLSPSYLGQEMGHTYGLNHSRRDGSTADYADPFDVMSTANARMAPHPVFHELQMPTGQPVFRIGPGLNAANMAALGWLDNSRIWTATSGSQVNTMVQLRPLHRRDLPGFLAARVGEYYVEFRMNEAWDADFGPAVLVHYLEDKVSYIVPNQAGSLTFQSGDELRTPASLSVLGSGLSIRVAEIDPANRIASVQIILQQPQISREWPKQGPFDTPWIKWSEVQSGEISLLITGGRVISFSKRAVWHNVLENIALFHDKSLDQVSPRLRAAIRDEVLRNVASLVGRETSRLAFREPAKPAVSRPSSEYDSSVESDAQQGASQQLETTQEEREMASTKDVLDHHLKCFGEGDLEGILSDYAPGAVLFTPDGPLRGADAIRSLFQGMVAEFGKLGATFSMKQQFVEGDYAYMLWSAETADNVYEVGPDTFVVRDGKIMAQSFTGKVTPKG